MTLIVGSLFAGIGGFDLGLERTGGFRTAWFCEQDKFCQRVLAKHWPDVPCYEDVCGLTGASVIPVDVLCGGFPCQDISLAGKGAGIGGTRSGLWSEYARLIGEIEPRWVIVENVAALLGRGLSVVLADLSALGYDAEWDCLPASAFGAPHQRDRVWLVAYPDSRRGYRSGSGTEQAGRRQPAHGSAAHPDTNGRRLQVCAQPDREPPARASDWDSRWRHADGVRHEVADTDELGRLEGKQRAWGPERSWPGDVERAGQLPRDDWWATEPHVGRVANGVPARVDRLRSLGNALVPQIPEWIGYRILAHEQTRGRP